MNEKPEIDTLLQNALDELFALQQQAKEEHQKFLVESATLIKTSHKQVNDSSQAAARAEKAARESAEAAKNLSRAANAAHDGLRVWQRAAVWFGAGYFVVGIALGAMYFYLGKQIEIRTQEVSALHFQQDTLIAASKNKTKSKSAHRKENYADDESQAN